MSQPDPNKCHVIYCGIDKFLYPDTGNKMFLFLYLLQMGSNFDSNYAKRLASKLLVANFQGQFVYAARCAQTRGKILFLRAPHAMVPKVSYELRTTSAANTYLVCTTPESMYSTWKAHGEVVGGCIIDPRSKTSCVSCFFFWQAREQFTEQLDQSN